MATTGDERMTRHSTWNMAAIALMVLLRIVLPTDIGRYAMLPFVGFFVGMLAGKWAALRDLEESEHN